MIENCRRALSDLSLLVAILAIHLGLAFSLSFEDSEIWGVTSSQRIFDTGLLWNSAWFKPAFSAMLGALPMFTTDNWTILILGRTLSWIFSIVSIVSLYRILPGRKLFYLAISVLSPFMLLNLTKIRSDMFSVAITLAAVHVLLLESIPNRLRTFVYLMGSSLVMLTTPKSIDLFAILAMSTFSQNRSQSAIFEQILGRALLLFAPIAAVFLTFLLFSKETFVHLFRYANDIYSGPHFWGGQSWVYILNFAKHSPISILVVVTGIGLGIANRSHLTRRERALLVGGIFSILTTLITPQKFPFLIASRLPIWLLAASVGTEIGLARFNRVNARRLTSVMIVGSLFITAYYFSTTPYRHFGQSEQRVGYSQFESLVKEMAPVTYWDAIGLFPLTNNVFHFPSPQDSKNDEILDYIQDIKPQLVIATSKVQLLGFPMEEYLNQNYIEFSPHVWIKRCQLPSREPCQWLAGEVLTSAKNCGLRAPLALYSSTMPSTTNPARSIRIPFSFSNGAQVDVLSENLPWSIQFPTCNNSLFVTEAAPLAFTVLPDPQSLFGFSGLL